MTSFVGREGALAEVKQLLDASRLLTLVGSGGMGKTRLALRIAGGLVDAYTGGAWLVDLAPVADPLLVPLAVAAALGVPEQPGRSMLVTLAEPSPRGICCWFWTIANISCRTALS